MRRNLFLETAGLGVCLTVLLVLAGTAAAGAQPAEPAASQFFFPRFVAVDGVSSGIALFNPSLREARVQLFLIHYDGTLLADPVDVPVPPRGQVVRTAGELFGDESPLDASLLIMSSTPGLIACYQTFDNLGTFIDGSEAPEAATSLVFPVIPGRYDGVAEIDLLNPNVRPTGVELKLWGTGGNLLGRAVVQVPAGGTYRDLAEYVFPAGTDFSNASHITATARPVNILSQAQTVSGTSLFAGFSSVAPAGGSVDVASLNALSLAQTSNAGVLPYFRAGQQHASTVSVANVEASNVDLTLTAIGNNGVPWGSRRVTLPANGGYRAPVTTAFPALAGVEAEGWVLVQASGRVAASLIYGARNLPSLTALPLQKTPKFDSVIPQVVSSAASFTELTVVNPGSTAASVDVVVVRPSGESAASIQLSLVPGGRLSAPLVQFLPELGPQSGGYVYLHASQPVFASALVGDAAGATLSGFTAAPLTVPYAPPALKAFAVTGRVTLNDRPAPGFRVVLSGPAGGVVTTASDGTYVFKGLPAGRYSMTVDQFGFQFFPGQTSFELSTASRRQDFVGSTSTNGIVVTPAAFAVGSADTTVTVFGRDFNSTSQAYVGDVRLKTTLVDPTQLRVVIPAYMLGSPSRFQMYVATETGGSERRVTQVAELVAFVDRPTVTGITTPGSIMEGSSGTTITVRGTGFLAGARLLINGISDEIEITQLADTQILAWVPSRYFARGGIYPVSVQNPYPSNVESNIQLLAVYYPAPAVEILFPSAVPARLEPSAGPLTIEVLGYGFRRGAVVLFNGQPLSTTYCEGDAYCLSVHLYAKVPPSLLRQSGFAIIVVKNPDPSLGSSESAFLRIDGLQPAVASVVPGSATALDLPFQYNVPVVVNGTNFGPQTVARVYKLGVSPLPNFSAPTVLSSTQLYASITVEYPDALGEWVVEVANPPPGGGKSEPVSFVISEGTFVANPFLISMTPEFVAAGGPAFTLTINGTNLKDGAVVQFYTTLLATAFVSDRQVRAEVPASLIQSPGRIPISVINPDTGGASNRLFLEIR